MAAHPTTHQQAKVAYDLVPSPLGPLFVALGEQGIVALEFHADGSERERLAARGLTPRHDPEALAEIRAQIRDYFAGRRETFDLPVDLSALTSFEREALEAVARIPFGQTRTYGEIAQALGKPGGSQAVGQAMGRNPVPLIIPCHRVIAGGNKLHGYSGRGGVETKTALLRLEGSVLI